MIIKGDGLDFTLAAILYKGRLHVSVLKKVLAAKRLVLVSIDGADPTTDDKGYSLRGFHDGQDVIINAALKPGAHQGPQKMWRGRGTCRQHVL